MEERHPRRNRPPQWWRSVVLRVPRLDRYAVCGGSMLPTLAPEDHLLVVRPPGRLRPGDIVLARFPAEPEREIVKRVAAVLGPRRDRRYILLGDNAAASTDSRRFGALERDAITARVLCRYWPNGRQGRVR